MKRYFLFSYLAFLLAGSQSVAAQIENTMFQDLLSVAGQHLKLNGLGLRKATLFKVRVYAAGLYLVTPSQNSEAILNSTHPKVLVMKFLRDVSQQQINEAWDATFQNSKIKFYQELVQLKKIMPNAKEGDTLEYVFLSDKTEFKINKVAIENMPSGEWGKALLATWIGNNPPTEELKRGLLGIKDSD
ncbi:MAG: hypothetical protein EXR74_03900 [Bdellovibrionales bacterium]|nr:hypothetical protein [Bdellovibrionales bacterium]